MYEYPYGNAQQLNLDWLLTEWRKFQTAVEAMIANQWSDTETYAENDVVIHNHVLLYCNVAQATVGQFVATEWTAFNIADAISN